MRRWCDMIKRGYRYQHPHWLDQANAPLVVQVTKVSGETVYYRAVGTSGELEGTSWYVGAEKVYDSWKRL